MDDLNLILPNSRQSFVINSDVLRVFLEARQITLHDKETGGILLAKITKNEVRIVEATRAETEASISRWLFKPSLRQKRRIVRAAFSKDLHFIGEWHTHPEEDPNPSPLDIDSMKDTFLKSKHELNYFVMIIVGNRRNELSMSITLHSRDRVESLGVVKAKL
jgi:integrative and conjugative element protein (TIGR02256 family)